MIEILMDGNRLQLRTGNVDLRPRHQSQFAFWGFRISDAGTDFSIDCPDTQALIPKLVRYLKRERLPFEVTSELQSVIDDELEIRGRLAAAIAQCSKFKDAALDIPEAREFLSFLASSIPRKLKEHQVKAALHLFCARNAANFSVPGSGKTTVVLAVYERLRQLGEVDALFVVGPPACFGPWQHEFQATLGTQPRCQVLAGGDIDLRRYQYHVDRDTVCDIYLTSFQTLQNDWEHVRILFQRQGIRFFLVIDEAHYIKQIGGTWADAVLNVAKYAARRCVLTGTPFPRTYTDSFNLFDALWPGSSPICPRDRHRIELHTQRKEYGEAASVLRATIGPLFYRVRKSDLNLAPQVFHEPIRIRMNERERTVYDSILDRIIAESENDFFRDFELLRRLRRGRMIRLRQCISYAGLLSTAVEEYHENLIEGDESVGDIIRRYDELEVPEKLNVLASLVGRFREQQEKVVVWSNFVGTLKLIDRHLQHSGHGVGLIYGGTPFERSSVQEEMTREDIIREFVDPNSGMSVLVANPAACAESISLHKACSTAVYYDLSYNCAQYLQSLDRIHRVGGSEEREAHYYFLQYKDSLDRDILLNVRQKAQNMSTVIDEEFPIYGLDMFAEDEEFEAYERLFANTSQRV